MIKNIQLYLVNSNARPECLYLECAWQAVDWARLLLFVRSHVKDDKDPDTDTRNTFLFLFAQTLGTTQPSDNSISTPWNFHYIKRAAV